MWGLQKNVVMLTKNGISRKLHKFVHLKLVLVGDEICNAVDCPHHDGNICDCPLVYNARSSGNIAQSAAHQPDIQSQDTERSIVRVTFTIYLAIYYVSSATTTV